MTVRVRYSPAPSGELHIGSVSTALFNWIFARHEGGTFVLRIEDTDATRTREEWVTGIQDTLRWLGLDWDEGPFRQTDRTARYQEAVDQLLAEGAAYECFCTAQELEERNDAARAAGRAPGYDGHCRDLSTSDRDARRAEGRSSVVRFRTPDVGVSEFHDAIRGEVRVDWENIRDFVILRSDGSPIFFLANAVDDIDQGITHVIRGEDLIDTTHRVLALRRALGGGEQPVYAHLPLILSADRAKLSKRHGAVAVEEFREQGILPEALLNYLWLMGWSLGEDTEEVHALDELVESFALERVTHTPAVFDAKKLEWMNGEWIRRLTLDDLIARVEPLVRDAVGDRFDAEVLRHAVEIGQTRATTLVQLAEQTEFLFVTDDAFTIDADAWARLEAIERGGDVLELAIAHVEACDWTVDAINLVEPIKALALKPGKVMAAVYVAVEGRAQGLPVFDGIWLLGRDRSLARLRAARDRLG